MSSRNWLHPSPRVILPLRSTTLTELTWRVTAFMLTIRSSLIGIVGGIDSLHQGDLRSRSWNTFDAEIIHERPDQENSASRDFKKILRSQGIRNLADIKTGTLVADVNLQP